MRVQPSGRVTANFLSANAIRPVVARLAPAVATGVAAGVALGGDVTVVMVGVTVAGAPDCAVLPPQATRLTARSEVARPPNRRRESVEVMVRRDSGCDVNGRKPIR